MRYTKVLVPILSSTRSVLYHGTTDLNLNSIKKHGLSISNKIKRFPSIGMRKDNQGEPFGGIYLGSKETATEYAINQAKKWGGNPILVQVVFKPDNYVAFDDDIIGRIIHLFKPYYTGNIAEMLEKLFKFLYNIEPEVTRTVVNDRIVWTIEQMLPDFENSSKKLWNRLAIYLGPIIPLIKKCRYKNYNPLIRIRYLKDIGYKGKNRILNIEKVDANIKTASQEELKKQFPVPKEYEQYFIKRQHAHERRVRHNATRIADAYPSVALKLLDAADKHDLSKWENDEYYGYIWLTANKSMGKDYPSPDLEHYAEDIVWKHHYENNKHHPEYWIARYSLEDMPDYELAHMVADWAAMSQELGTSLIAWYYNKAKKIYKFGKKQEKEILKYISLFNELLANRVLEKDKKKD